jgi:hypothetical protein
MAEAELHASDQMRVQRAVSDAQEVTGLQFTVVFCLGGDGMHEQAEGAFRKLGVIGRPAVLVMVEPVVGSFDLELNSRAAGRIVGTDLDQAVEVMTECYDKTGDLAECVERGLEVLCKAAGPSEGGEVAGPALPDVLLVTPEPD